MTTKELTGEGRGREESESKELIGQGSLREERDSERIDRAEKGKGRE